MDRRYLFHITSGIAGGVLTVLALSSITTNGVSASTGLMAVGGGGMILGAGYELLYREDSQFEPNRILLAALLLFTALALAGAALSILF